MTQPAPPHLPPPTSGLQVSLAAWSLHRAFRAGELDQVGMVRLCAELGIRGFEFVNTFFPSPQFVYLQRLKALAADLDVRLLLIMCDGEGELAAADAADRRQAVRNHFKWVDIAEALGCHAIRCNVHGDDSDDELMKQRAAESFASLLEYAEASGVNVLIENHGRAGRYGCFAHPDWLADLFRTVGHPRFGSLPDFGNFPPETDRYGAVRTLMPFAKAVSAKCYEFGPDGRETRIDFARMIEIVREAGYRGFVGIEYEGAGMPEREGILACKRLLERLL